MADLDHYLALIRQLVPQLSFETAEFNHRGQNSRVLILDHAWIFRFPRYAHLIASYRLEAELLSRLQGVLPLAIPDPRITLLEENNPDTCVMGYRLLPGQPLYRDVFQTVTDPKILDSLAQQLAGFLSALHTLPPSVLSGLPLPLQDTRQTWIDFYDQIRDRLSARMRPQAWDEVQKHFESYLASRENFEFQPALIHGDFGGSNILYMGTESRISGILDFSSAGLGDPASDWAGLLSSYGEEFLQRCRRFAPAIEALIPRIRFYRGTFALQEALFGLEHDDEAALKAGLAPYC